MKLTAQRLDRTDAAGLVAGAAPATVQHANGCWRPRSSWGDRPGPLAGPRSPSPAGAHAKGQRSAYSTRGSWASGAFDGDHAIDASQLKEASHARVGVAQNEVGVAAVDHQENAEAG
jgi:hypothetical protein